MHYNNYNLTNPAVYRMVCPARIAEFISVSGSASGTSYEYDSMSGKAVEVTTTVSAVRTSSSIITFTITGTGDLDYYDLWCDGSIKITAKDRVGNSGPIAVRFLANNGAWSYTPYVCSPIMALAGEAAVNIWYVGLATRYEEDGCVFKSGVSGEVLKIGDDTNNVTAAYESGRIKLTIKGAGADGILKVGVTPGDYYHTSEEDGLAEIVIPSNHIKDGKWADYPPCDIYPLYPSSNITTPTPTPSAILTLYAPYGYTFAETPGQVLTTNSAIDDYYPYNKASAVYSSDGRTVTITLGDSGYDETYADGLVFGLKDAVGNSYLTKPLMSTWGYISGGKWTQDTYEWRYSSVISDVYTLVPAETVCYDVSTSVGDGDNISGITAVRSSDVTKLEVKLENGILAVTAKKSESSSDYSSVNIKIVYEDWLGNLNQKSLTGFSADASGDPPKITALGSFGSASYIPRSVR